MFEKMGALRDFYWIVNRLCYRCDAGKVIDYLEGGFAYACYNKAR